jgi:hypothetical protein
LNIKSKKKKKKRTKKEKKEKKKERGYYGLNWNIDFYYRNLDFGYSGQHRLLWSKLRHWRFWSTSATMVGIWTSTILAGSGYYGRNFFELFFIFFNKRELGEWYLLVKEIMAMQHVILTKREIDVGAGREIARAQDEETKEKQKLAHDG